MEDLKFQLAIEASKNGLVSSTLIKMTTKEINEILVKENDHENLSTYKKSLKPTIKLFDRKSLGEKMSDTIENFSLQNKSIDSYMSKIEQQEGILDQDNGVIDLDEALDDFNQTVQEAQIETQLLDRILDDIEEINNQKDFLDNYKN